MERVEMEVNKAEEDLDGWKEEVRCALEDNEYVSGLFCEQGFG